MFILSLREYRLHSHGKNYKSTTDCIHCTFIHTIITQWNYFARKLQAVIDFHHKYNLALPQKKKLIIKILTLFTFSGQMFLMNKFFDGEFMTFGLDVIRHMEADQEDRMDPMIYIFPRMTKCTFYKYGVSGEVSS